MYILLSFFLSSKTLYYYHFVWHL